MNKRNTMIIMLVVLVLLVMVIAVACNSNTSTTTSTKSGINTNYEYQKASYEGANGSWVTINITGWRLDPSGFIELSQENNKKILVHSSKVILYTNW